MLDEITGQPVEQLRMCGRLALAAEVAGRGHNSLSEMPVPNPVDDDARRQRMARSGQPQRQRAPPFGNEWTIRGFFQIVRSAQYAREPGRNLRSRRMEIAAGGHLRL